MRKIVFEGTINGKTFDNVQDYNNEMNRLLSNGETIIQASSQTSVVDEPECDTYIEEEKKNKEFDIQDFTPLFKEDDGCYLDLLSSDDKEYNSWLFGSIDTALSEALENLKNVIEDDQLSIDDAFELINAFKTIRLNVSNDKDDNDAAIHEISDRIKKDTNTLDLLRNASTIINAATVYYDAAFKMVKDYLLGF